MGRADVDHLRSHGFDDAAISSCVQVVAYFNYINRIAEGLGVEAEDWIEADGREIGSVARWHYSFMGATDPSRMEDAGRLVGRLLREDGATGALLVPV